MVAQYLFQAELQALYNDPQLIAIIPDLAERCRAEQARLDLADLDTEVPPAVPGPCATRAWARAMGWIFVSEGSKLGAAFLIKRAVAWNCRNFRCPTPGRTGRWPCRRLETVHPHS